MDALNLELPRLQMLRCSCSIKERTVFSVIIAGNQRITGDLLAGPMKPNNCQDGERCASQHGDDEQVELDYMQPPAAAKPEEGGSRDEKRPMPGLAKEYFTDHRPSPSAAPTD